MDGTDAPAGGAPSGGVPPDDDATAPPGRLDAALATGTLAAIATGGALLGFGWREGDPGRMFRLAGRALLERAGVASGALPLTAVALGYVHHLLVASAWGTVLALCVVPWRGRWAIPSALVVAAVYGWLANGRLPVPIRIGLAVTEQPGAVVSIAASLAVALVGGAWLARRAGSHAR